MTRTGGYSIIELAVTLSVMAIVASIAIPGFSRWLPDYRLKAAATELYSNLQSAKMSAVRDNMEWALFFSPSFSLYQIKTGGPDGDYSTAADNTVEKTIWLSDYTAGAAYVAYGAGGATDTIPPSGSAPTDFVTFPGDKIVFSPRGMADSEGYIYLQNNKNVTYAVGSLTTGLILMRKWTGAAWE